jgi:hypothetical protein
LILMLVLSLQIVFLLLSFGMTCNFMLKA